MDNLFAEIGLLIIVATVLAIIARFLKQPAILAYVLTGVLLGPLGLKIIQQTDAITNLSSLGIALLLFLVGLELDLVKLRTIGKPSLVLGIGQVVFTAGFGYLIIKLFGVSSLVAWYIAVALTFSSTIIVVKLLSEQRVLDSLHGRLAVGMLLVQDFLAILALIILGGLVNYDHANIGPTVAFILAQGLLLVVITWLAGRWLLPPIFNRLARSYELLFLASLSWCFLFAGLASYVGFPIEIGAFLAGLALAPLPYNLDIKAKVRGTRDFFITLFFILLGSQLIFTANQLSLTVIIILSLFVLIGNPLIVMILLGLMNYRKRTGFLVGLTVAQISEFSLILMGMGLRLGHVSPTDASLVTIVGIITITVSTYFITHGEKLYRWLSPYLNIFEKASTFDETEPVAISGHVVIFGYHRLGEQVVAALQKIGKSVVVIDFNPIAVHYLKQQQIPCFYGDMTDLELLEKLQIKQASLIISTNSDIFDNLTLLQNLKLHNISIPFYATADTWHDVRDLYATGASYVIFPHYLAGVHFSHDLIASLSSHHHLQIDKTKHLTELEHRYARAR